MVDSILNICEELYTSRLNLLLLESKKRKDELEKSNEKSINLTESTEELEFKFTSNEGDEAIKIEDSMKELNSEINTLEKKIKKLYETLTKHISSAKNLKTEINKKSSNGFTILHMVSSFEDCSLVSLVLSKAANPNSKDKKLGWTPCHFAAFYLNLPVLCLLIENGGKLDILDSSNRTPLDLVKQELKHFLKSKEELEEKELFTWGAGSNFQLGHGGPESKILPKKVKGLQNYSIKQVSINEFHSSCVTVEGKIWIWGIGSGFRLGLGDEETQAYPVLLSVYKNRSVSTVSCGFLHSAFVTTFGEVFTFGSGEYGQLGHGENVTKLSSPRKIFGTLEGKQITQVSCGRFHSACVTSNGEILTWGFGELGALGHGEGLTSNQYSPRIISSWKNCQMKQVSAGKNQTIAVTCSGEVYITGFGKNAPRRFLKNRQFISIGCDSNGDKSTFVTSDGKVLLWAGDEKQQPFEIALPDGLAIKAEPSVQRILILSNKGNLYEWTEVNKSIQRYDMERVVDIASCKTHCAALVGKLKKKRNVFSLGKALNQIVGVEEFSDIKLQLDDNQIIPAHRIILACRSPVFRKQILATNLKNQTISIPKCSREGLLLFLTFMYTNEIQGESPLISSSSVSELERLVKLYQVGNSNHFEWRKLLKNELIFCDETSSNKFQTDILWALSPESESLSDLRIQIEENGTEESILTHRLILACRSSYFQTMLASPFQWQESTSEFLNIAEVRFKTMKRLIQFLYTENLGKMQPQTVLELLMAANRFFLDDLRQVCTDHIREFVDLSNVLDILELAESFQAIELKEYCFSFLAKNPTSVLELKLLHDIDSKLSKEMKRYFQSKKDWNKIILLKEETESKQEETEIKAESNECEMDDKEKSLATNETNTSFQPVSSSKKKKKAKRNLSKELNSSEEPSIPAKVIPGSEEVPFKHNTSKNAITKQPSTEIIEPLLKSPPMNVPTKKTTVWAAEVSPSPTKSFVEIQKEQSKGTPRLTPPSSNKSSSLKSSSSPSSMIIGSSPSLPSTSPLKKSPRKPNLTPPSTLEKECGSLSPPKPALWTSTLSSSNPPAPKKSFIEIQKEQSQVFCKAQPKSIKEIQNEEEEKKVEMLLQEDLDRAIAESLQMEFIKEEEELIFLKQQKEQIQKQQHYHRNNNSRYQPKNQWQKKT